MDVESILIRLTDTIRHTMRSIEIGAHGIALLVDDHNRLLSTITDGDLRRAILAGLQLDSPVTEVLNHKPNRRKSITAAVNTPRDEQLRIMKQHDVRHLPLLDMRGTVCDLAVLDDLGVDELEMPVQAVIMAGGFGKRLRPLTDDLPKPMLPIGGRPLMERTIQCLEQAGIRRINITTHFMPEKITGYFGSGTRHGVELKYVAEKEPLGTAGALRLVDETDEPLLVMNGDILTRVDFRALLTFHREHNSALTVGVRQYEVELPYGVIDARDGVVVGLREKPKYGFLVNAGVYIVEPSVRRHIPFGRKYDMTELIDQLIQQKEVVSCFPIVEYWLDIGRHEDFQKAERDVRELRWAA